MKVDDDSGDDDDLNSELEKLKSMVKDRYAVGTQCKYDKNGVILHGHISKSTSNQFGEIIEIEIAYFQNEVSKKISIKNPFRLNESKNSFPADAIFIDDGMSKMIKWDTAASKQQFVVDTKCRYVTGFDTCLVGKISQVTENVNGDIIEICFEYVEKDEICTLILKNPLEDQGTGWTLADLLLF